MNLFIHPGSKPKKLYTSILLLSLTAILVTLLLISAHYQNEAGSSFCNIDDYWNCDRVNKSEFAEILGIPVSILGFLYYIVFTTLTVLLLKGYDFQKKLAPFTPRVLLKIATFLGSLGVLGVLAFELNAIYSTAPGAMTPALLAWICLKAAFFILFFLAIWRYCRKSTHPAIHFNGFLAIFALFGVLFSLYLTDIELFVLNAICIYCLTQQILIIIIAGLTLIALNKNKHGHSNSSSG